MMTVVLVLVILIAMMQVRFWWIQGEHTVTLDYLHDALDGVDFDIRDIHQVTGAQRAPHREMLQQRRLKGEKR